MRLIAATGPEPDLLRFFQAICSCKGKQIISNQEGVLKRLYEETPEINPSWRRRLLLETKQLKAWDGVNAERFFWRSQSDNQEYKRKLDNDHHLYSYNEYEAGYQSELIERHGDFLGKDEWMGGFLPVFISWYGTDDWGRQDDLPELYYSAKALSIDPSCCKVEGQSCWVLAEALLWVLEPSKLKPPAGSEGIEREVSPKQEKLALYYEVSRSMRYRTLTH